MNTTTVNAVGFAYSSPEVILLFADHDRQQLQVYPPKNAGEQPKFANDGRKNMLLLLSVDSLPRLEQWSKKIHRILVFAKAEDLIGLHLPILDAMTADDGRLVPNRRQTRDEMLARIEKEAVPVVLDQSINAQRRARRRVEEATAYEGPTFRTFLKELRQLVDKDADGFTFADDIGVPSIMRLMGDTTQKHFKGACQRMIAVGGIPEDKAKALFRWVEGHDGPGPELGKAVDALLYPDEAAEEGTVTYDSVAQQHGVTAEDVRSVAKVYRQLQSLDSE